MQIEEDHSIDWVLPISASKYGNRVPVVTIRNGDILLNNIEKKQDFKLVAPSNLTNDKVIYASWTFQVCSTPVLFGLCNGFTTRPFHIFLIVKVLWTKNPLIDDDQSF